MASNDFQPEPIVATEQEQTQLAKLDEILSIPIEGKIASLPRLCTATGEQVELPESVFHLLRQLVHQLLLSKGVTLTTFHQPLTIWEAAALLNVQSQEIEQLLDTGTIPFSQAGMRRRIRFEDLMTYKKQQAQLRRQEFAERTPINPEFKPGE
ncbi:MAG TPA: excisionase family DNA-binding protein [Stenomitos sp.]